jgi:tetratricopeptide (TPR) repeat protein
MFFSASMRPFFRFLAARARQFAAFICIASFCVFARAQEMRAQTNPPNVDWAKVHTVTMEAITDLYSLRYSAAEQKCNEVIAMAPGDPRGHFFKAMTYFYRYRINQDKSDYQRFLQLSQNTISVCENILKNNPNETKALFYIGGSYGYRGLSRAFGPSEERVKNLMQAVWDGKKGYDYLNESLKADPQNADAQMGFGLFNCLIAAAPSIIKPAIRLAGLTSDRNLGLRQLESAAANGVYTRPEAGYWLSVFYAENEETAPRALWHLKNLLEKYPSNHWYRITAGSILLNTLRKPSEAVAYLEPVASAQTQEKTAQARAILLMGAASLHRLKFAEAAQWFQKCAALKADSGSFKNALFLQGLMNEMEGNRAQAIQFYRQSLPYKSSEELLESPLSSEQILLRRASFAFRGSEYQEAIRFAEEVLQQKQIAADLRGSALMLLGRSFAEQGDHTQAEQKFLQAAGLNTDNKSFLPTAYYRLGVSQAKLGKTREAKQSFDKALLYKDYDEEDYIKRRVQVETARLNKQLNKQ